MSFWDFFKFYNPGQKAFLAGRKALREKRYADAVPLFEQAINNNLEHHLFYYLRGTALHNLDRLDEALDDYNEALRLKPNHAGTHYNRGLLYLVKQDYLRALEDFSDAIEFEYNAFGWRAVAFMHLDRLDEAMRDIDVAIRRQPKITIHLIHKSSINRRMDQTAEAIENLEEALRLDPQSKPAHNQLAWMLATSEQPELRDGNRAVEHALKAVQGPNTPHPAFVGTLAASYAEAGRFEEAVMWAKRFLENNPPAENVEKATLRLELYRQNKPYREKRGEFETVQDTREQKK